MSNNQSSAIDIPKKNTHIIATSSSDGHTMLSSIVTDQDGQPVRRGSTSSNTGISPTYYTASGSIVQTTHESHSSPVYDDQSRIFFSHHSECSCKFSFFKKKKTFY